MAHISNQSPDTKTVRNEKRCPVCCETIQAGASKCTHCGSFQDWRRFMNVSSSVLALIVALISVLSFAIPAIKETFEEKNSNIILSFQSVESDFIYLIAYNTGVRAGSIGDGRLTVITPDLRRHTYPLKVSGQTGGEAFVSAGDSKLIKLYIKKKAISNLDGLPDKLSAIECLLEMEVINFNRHKENITLASKCSDYETFISDSILARQ